MQLSLCVMKGNDDYRQKMCCSLIIQHKCTNTTSTSIAHLSNVLLLHIVTSDIKITRKLVNISNWTASREKVPGAGHYGLETRPDKSIWEPDTKQRFINHLL